MESRILHVEVARNRSLHVPVLAGHRREGDDLIPVFTHRVAQPGEIVQVAEDEVDLLIERGFVIDPRAAPPAPTLVQDGSAPLDGRLNGMVAR